MNYKKTDNWLKDVNTNQAELFYYSIKLNNNVTEQTIQNLHNINDRINEIQWKKSKETVNSIIFRFTTLTENYISFLSNIIDIITTNDNSKIIEIITPIKLREGIDMIKKTIKTNETIPVQFMKEILKKGNVQISSTSFNSKDNNINE